MNINVGDLLEEASTFPGSIRIHIVWYPVPFYDPLLLVTST
jgi:hypothetical protein